MKLCTTLLAFLFTLPALAQQTIINDPNTQQRNVGSFTSIRASGGFEIFLTQGTQNALAVSGADHEITDAIQAEVQGGVLTLSMKGNWMARRPFNKKLRAYISVNKLELLEASGACEYKITGQIHSENLLVKLSGASEIQGPLEANNLSLDLGGASVAKISGTVQNLKITARGASDIKDYDLQTDNCIADIGGASDVRVTVHKSLVAQARGASTLFYHGNPERTDISSSGASSVSARN
ncbi:MAG: DUF2807 domain-containing protein [Bacteroidota bacterium]|nr:DUF2807 domain-containing protein [Bacteroidota bacterium]